MNTEHNREQLLNDYHRDGYVLLRGFLTADEVAELNENVDRYVQQVVPNLPVSDVFYDDKGRPDTLKQLQRMHQHDDYFKRLFIDSKFERLASLLLEDDAFGKNFQWFNKAPKVGQPTPPHQDGFYFMLDRPEALTMWLALEKVDEENGCVRYLPGSHKKGMREHSRSGTLGFSQSIADYGTDEELAAEIAMPAEPGDLLVHHALTVHRADGNQSESRSRNSAGFIYYAASAKEDTAAQEAYQKQLTKDRLAENLL